MPEETVNQKTIKRIRVFTEELENTPLTEIPRALTGKMKNVLILPGCPWPTTYGFNTDEAE